MPAMAAGPAGWQPVGSSANSLFSLKTNQPLPFCHKARNQRGKAMRDNETELMLKGFGLTTAELFYRMPDYRNVLNSFVWQEYDLAPDYPQLFKFIEFWQEKIDGPLHSVRFTHRKMISPGEWRNVVGEFRLH
jgi:uncharacterized protein Usg